MTLGYCNVCQKWGGHIDAECKWQQDPEGRRRYYCQRCERRYVWKPGLITCRKRDCIGIPIDIGPRLMRRKDQ